MVEDLDKRSWWGYVHDDIKELLLQSLLLVETAEKWEVNFSETFGRGIVHGEGFRDYSFIVFPAAKAYEGYLKKFFLDMGFITEEDYYGKRFRIGKALNPSLEREIREREGVYDRIKAYCGGEELAEKMWMCWKECRNLLFHWFPNEKNAVTLNEAKDRVNLILETIDSSFNECRIDNK